MISPLLNKKLMRPSFGAFLFSVLLLGCSNGGLREEPIELPETLPSAANLKVEWWKLLDRSTDVNAFGHLNPTVVGDSVFVALANGSVYELDEDGKVIQEESVASGITAPLVFDGEQMLVMTSEGEARLLDPDYHEIWSTKLGAMSLEQPLITDNRVFIQTIDGRINTLERITGRLLWVYQDAEPSLTITGTSAPVLIETQRGTAVVTGLSNGKVVALSVTDGSVLWEYRIAKASGKTDISRLVDVDSKVTQLDERLIATGYQGDMVVIDINSGRVLQALPFSSYRSVQSDGELWFGVNAQSHLVALNPGTLEEVWRIQDFQYRQLSEVLVDGDYLYVADFEGYVHVISAKDGEWLTSRQIDWKGSNGDPIKFRDGILFQGSSSRVKYLTVSAK